MCKKFFLLTIFFISTYAVKSQQYGLMTLEGTVKTNLGLPAKYTSLEVKKGYWNISASTTCNSDGKFRIEGIKQNDTIYFTCIGLKPAYIIADRIYRYLNIELQVDTFRTTEKDKKYKLQSKYYSAEVLLKPNIKFKESDGIISQKRQSEYLTDSETDITRFRKVEVQPEIESNSFAVFYDSLLYGIIRKREKIYRRTDRLEKEAYVKIFYTITKNSVLVDSVSSFYGKEIIKKAFEATIKGRPAVQNGRNINSTCFFEFYINNRGKDIFFNNL